MGTITVTGGTPAQQQAISAAHGALSAALPRAVTAAGQGTGGFAGWFGDASAGRRSAVAAAYQAGGDNLGSQDFGYDLTAALPVLLHAPVCVLFANVDSAGVTARLWDSFWPAYYLDARAGSADLALGIAHELLVSFDAGVIDLLGIDDAWAARELAAADPAAAVRCAANYTGFLAQFLSGP